MGTQRAGVQGYVRVVAEGGRGEGLVEEAVDERHSYVQGNVDEDGALLAGGGEQQGGGARASRTAEGRWGRAGKGRWEQGEWEGSRERGEGRRG